MPTNTYVALDRVTVGTATPSITFSSIPQGYTDLVLIATPIFSTAANVNIRINGDTGSNYSDTYINGNGTSATSARDTNQTLMYFSGTSVGVTTANRDNGIAHFMNYSNTTTNKTVLMRYNQAGQIVVAEVGLWRNTAAITSISLIASTGNLDTGSTFSLYGIKAQVTPGTAKATGGTITYDQSGNVIHTFTASGTFTPTSNISNVEYLVIAGGGSGGQNNSGAGSGGGGAGGYRSSVFGELSGANSFPESTLSCASGVGLTVTVGAGGAALGIGANQNGNNGNNSVFGSITSTGGGGGGGVNSSSASVGSAGGSGGGGNPSTVSSTGGAGTANQGFAGGIGGIASGSSYAGGGGGGAGAVGAASTSGGAGGAGGNGISSSINGTTTFRAGGGGGSTYGSVAAAGGTGGGGAGAPSTGSPAGVAGTANTGGGGGGVYGGGNASGAGGSGIVIVRYSGV
jgi:hypothetical protein